MLIMFLNSFDAIEALWPNPHPDTSIKKCTNS